MTEATQPVATEVTKSEDTARQVARRRSRRAPFPRETAQGRESQLECENALLKRLVADLVLEKTLLSDRLEEIGPVD